MAAPGRGGPTISPQITALISVVIALALLALGWLKSDINRLQDQIQQVNTLLNERNQKDQEWKLLFKELIEEGDRRQAELVEAVCLADKAAKYDGVRCTSPNRPTFKYSPSSIKVP